MNECEEIAYRYLCKKFEDQQIDYEPNGEKTYPDFLVGGEVAVEVTRLYQHYLYDGGRVESLEQLQAKFFDWLDSELADFRCQKLDASWFVSLSIKRPRQAEDAKEVFREFRTKLKRCLRDFASNPNLREREISLLADDNFRVRLTQASKNHGKTYLLGGFNDIDQGGYVIAEILENLNLTIKKKTDIARKADGSANATWLIIINYMMPINHGNELREVADYINASPMFQRAIMINRRNEEDVTVLW